MTLREHIQKIINKVTAVVEAEGYEFSGLNHFGCKPEVGGSPRFQSPIMKMEFLNPDSGCIEYDELGIFPKDEE